MIEAAARSVHRLDNSAHAEEHAGQVYFDDSVPFSDIEVFQRAIVQDSRIVDQYVEPAKPFYRRTDRSFPVTWVGDIEVYVQRRLIELRSQRRTFLVEHITRDNHRPFIR